ncbi:VOC family protein [Devosia oryziradicis]|uniref:VOC family protein n=1 Tax=Devosia oryziradicis TaxID=2801335 RepID=A0ABX7BYC5_9HYPH|nr:VOC family protein [Devosia oryziradicis]QQR36964.1 VOC family protein [Devosia oryziradicis]
MKLNHANLAVVDVGATIAFFERFLGFTVLTNRNDAFAVLDDGHGFVFNLVVPAKGEVIAYSRNFHLGFFVADEAAVRDKHAELIAAGVEAGGIQFYKRGTTGSVGFYCMTPGGFLIEVAANL